MMIILPSYKGDHSNKEQNEIYMIIEKNIALSRGCSSIGRTIE